MKKLTDLGNKTRRERPLGWTGRAYTYMESDCVVSCESSGLGSMISSERWGPQRQTTHIPRDLQGRQKVLQKGF